VHPAWLLDLAGGLTVARLTRRGRWVAGFLGVTGVALVLELVASFDSSPDTVPWTDLIVRHVPHEVTAAVLGALICWLPVHFALRYWRKRRGRDLT
jgi:hypothetical protein